MTQYQTYIEWLQVEPNVELIVPAIKEDIAKALLTKSEIDALRSRVLFIKNNGHEAYLKNDPVQIAKEFFPELIELCK